MLGVVVAVGLADVVVVVVGVVLGGGIVLGLGVADVVVVGVGVGVVANKNGLGRDT